MKEKSALGELLKHDFTEMPLMQLYRASDRLLRSKYKLRTTLTDWDDETLWRTYTMLTDLESVFRSLKSELGMRPVYHQKEDRCDGHLFITV
ncbi:MAG: transposase, partial [Akkermansiaceae bacterium]